jgi:paraquat-inducible protein B
VAFDVPSFASPSEPAEENAVFTLFRNQASAMKQPDPIARRYVVYTDSLEGLQVGAPVKLLGVTAGEVADVGLTLDPKTRAFRPRLLITFFPERVIAQLTPEQKSMGRALVSAGDAERLAMVRHQIEDLGLRAQLRTGNLLTGERYVALDYDPKAKRPDIDWSQDPLELPVSPGGLADLESKASGILDQVHDILATVDRMPLEPIAKDLQGSLKKLDRLLESIDAKTLPEFDKTVTGLRDTLAVAQRLLTNTDQTLLGKDAPAQQELRDALLEITRAARAVRVLADYLERNPGALIRGKDKWGQ